MTIGDRCRFCFRMVASCCMEPVLSYDCVILFHIGFADSPGFFEWFDGQLNIEVDLSECV